VASEAVKCVLRISIPLDGGVKDVAAVGISRFHATLAAKGVVLGAHVTSTPLASRVRADLPDDVDGDATLTEDYRIVTVEEIGGGLLVGLRKY